ncbi:MAG: hypothetical protein OXH41_09015 [Chloroflexi bacterium]|nr:hypothetical protein [Chloroflexota bacterium]
MPKKKSVKMCAQRFRRDADELLEFCREASTLSDRHTSLAYEVAIIKLYAAFERLMVGALTGAINNDTAALGSTTRVDFPKHLTDGVCEYIITGGKYFDFHGRSGLIGEIKKYVPKDHYLLKAVKDPAYRQSLDRLCALRNYAAHESTTSKRAALDAVGQRKMRSAGSWLKVQNRFGDLACRLSDLSCRVEQGAPY